MDLSEKSRWRNDLNRWYDPNVGRWISKDPIGFEAGDANLYRYVGNGATFRTDPSGLWWWDDDWISHGIGGMLGFHGDEVLEEASQSLGRPGFNLGFAGGGYIGPGGQVVLPSYQIIWNWGELSFDFYEYHNAIPCISDGLGWEDVVAGGIGTPGASFNVDLGFFFAYDLPSISPSDYEGSFNEYSGGFIGPGIGGYFNYAVSPGANQNPWTSGDGPWSIGGGVSLGIPGGFELQPDHLHSTLGVTFCFSMQIER